MGTGVVKKAPTATVGVTDILGSLPELIKWD